MKLLAAAALLLALVAPRPASALDAGDAGDAVDGGAAPYVVFRAGGIRPQSRIDLAGGFERGVAIEGGVGLSLGPYFAVEATGRRYAIEGTAADFSGVTADGEATVVSIGATLKAGIPSGVATLYGEAGIDLTLVAMDALVSVPGYAPVQESDRDRALGFHIGAELWVPATRHASVVVEAKYLIASATLFDLDVGLDALLVTGGLAWRF